MTVLTSKLRTSIRRVVVGRELSYQELRRLLYRVVIHDYAMAMCLWPVYQREQYIRELIR